MTYSLRHFFSLNSFYIFCLLAVLLAGTLVPRLIAYMPAIAGLLLTIIYVSQEKKFFAIDKTLFIFLTGLTAWAALSSVWSFNGEFSIQRSFKIALILFPAFLFFSLAPKIKGSDYICKVIVGLFVSLTLFLWLEKSLGHPVTEYVLGHDVTPHKSNRSFVVITLLSVPVLFLVQQANWPKKKVIQFALIVLVGGALTQTISQTAQLCFIVGLIFLYLLPPKKLLIKLFFGGLIILTCALPFMIKPVKGMLSEEAMDRGIFKQASVLHRFEIWEYSTEMAFEKPLIGNGVDSLRFMTANKWMTHQKSDQALHSHNVILQFWVEFGVIGALILITFFIISLRKMLAVENDDKRRLYLSLYAAVTSCVLTGYGFWQSWHLGLLMFLATLAVFISSQNYKDFGSKNQ